MKDQTKYSHLDEEKRGIIRDMVYQDYSSREIAKNIGVCHTTIQREVKRNRIVKVPRIRVANQSIYCINYDICGIKTTTCKTCTSEFTYCKKCKKIKCFDWCKHFEPRQCEKTLKWPYICTSRCPKFNKCKFPKYSYSPASAEKKYQSTLVDARSKPMLTPEQLKTLTNLLYPYIIKGMSPYAALEFLKDEVPVDVRTIYRYIEEGLLDIPSIKLPRKVRYKKRNRKKNIAREKIDRTGRTYSDYLKLAESEREQFWQMDSIEGKKINKHRILTIHLPLIKFQLMQLVKSSSPFHVVNILDYYERLLGSRREFNRIFPGFLVDRGCEFDLTKEMERSSFEPLKKRCKVYYCDPNRPDQKGSAEKNHEHIRTLLPKKISDFDKLTNYDVAEICCNVNSYPRKSLDGNAPIAYAKEMLPKNFLHMLGIKEILPRKLTMKFNT